MHKQSVDKVDDHDEHDKEMEKCLIFLFPCLTVDFFVRSFALQIITTTTTTVIIIIMHEKYKNLHTKSYAQITPKV